MLNIPPRYARRNNQPFVTYQQSSSLDLTIIGFQMVYPALPALLVDEDDAPIPSMLSSGALPEAMPGADELKVIKDIEIQ